MQKTGLLFLVIYLFVGVLPVRAQTDPTGTPTPTETPIPTTPPTGTPTPTATDTPLPTSTPTHTPTPLPTGTPTLPPTPTPTNTPTAGDAYELDNPPQSAAYAGPQLRSFNPNGDIDYVRYRLKGGLTTYITTQDLTGAADTEIFVYRDDDGYLTEDDPLLAYDDDGGVGLGSRIVIEVAADIDVTIVIQNRAIAFGPEVGYSIRIIDSLNATPTPTPTFLPTFTPWPTYTPYPSPTAVVPTYTPFPTYTPYPPPTAAPTSPPRPGGGYVPQPTPLPDVISIHIYIDFNGDQLMGVGEEASGVLVIMSTPDKRHSVEGYTQGGSITFQMPPEFPDNITEVLVTVPYLNRSGVFVVGEDGAEIRLKAPTFPVFLP